MTASLSPRWREANETLSTLLTWLEETGQWVEMRATAGPQTDSAETTAAVSASEVSPEAEAVGSPDLFALLASLTALRQEAKLQTRSARHDREQTAQALEQVSQTVAQLDTMRQADRERYEAAVQEAERTIAAALVDVHDAFSRATREAERIVASVATGLRQWSVWLPPGQDRVTETLPSLTSATPAVFPPRRQQGVFSRLRARFRRPPPPVNVPTTTRLADTARPDAAAVLQQYRNAAGPMADRLEGLAAGYKLSLERLERLLVTYGIEPIACLGQSVDAELMEVVQVVVDSSQPSGVVLDEVRRGYRRHGRVYRFAQVVATRAAPPADGTPSADVVQRQEEA